MSWRKLAAVTLPAMAFAVLLAACLTEIWVRHAWNPTKGTPGFFLSDAFRGQRLAANYDGWFAGVPVHINSLELRDRREYALEKAPNTFRILVLGDSVTFGHGAVHSYPELLEERLKAWRPEVDWQVWNAAVPGYNTSQELAHLLEVGPRFRPDLVIVGFFDNDLVDNRPVERPGIVRRAGAALNSAARRYLYSYELYKKIALTLAWRLSSDQGYRARVENLGSEEALISSIDNAGALPSQQISPYERLTDEAVASVNCIYGMKANPDTVPAIEREAGFPAWREAVRGFQQLSKAGTYRIVFFLNVVPPVCPDGDVFYDGGTRAVNAFYMKTIADGLPTVSAYDEFLHLRPSQMPNARAHAFGNSNAVKADVLFGFLRQQGLLPAPSTPSAPTTH